MADQSTAMPGVIAHLTIRDGKGSAAIDFYKAAFGAEENGRHLAEDGTRIMHAHLVINGGALMLNDDFPEYTGGAAAPEPSRSIFRPRMPTLGGRARLRRARRSGCRSTTSSGGDRHGQLVDPFGHSWSIGGPVTG